MKKLLLKSVVALSLISPVVASTVVSPIEVHAQNRTVGRGITGTYTEESTSQGRLTSSVQGAIADNIYTTVRGDTVHGSDLMSEEGELNSELIGDLTEKEKNRFVYDIDQQVNRAQEEDIVQGVEENPITEDTVSNFWKRMAEEPTVASRIITVAGQGFRPDFRGAAVWLRPIFPVFNTLTALFVMVALSMVFFHLALDMFFFNSPVFQYFVMNGGSDNKVLKIATAFVSQTAIDCLKKGQESGKEPLVAYFMRSWFKLTMFCIMLLYFVSNSLLYFVGPIVSLFSKILGF